MDVRVFIDTASEVKGWLQGRVVQLEYTDCHALDDDECNMLRITFPELPPERDILKDLWSVDLA